MHLEEAQWTRFKEIPGNDKKNNTGSAKKLDFPGNLCKVPCLNCFTDWKKGVEDSSVIQNSLNIDVYIFIAYLGHPMLI